VPENMGKMMRNHVVRLLREDVGKDPPADRPPEVNVCCHGREAADDVRPPPADWTIWLDWMSNIWLCGLLQMCPTGCGVVAIIHRILFHTCNLARLVCRHAARVGLPHSAHCLDMPGPGNGRWSGCMVLTIHPLPPNQWAGLSTRAQFFASEGQPVM
jgi:hypothetical protein